MRRAVEMGRGSLHRIAALTAAAVVLCNVAPGGQLDRGAINRGQVMQITPLQPARRLDSAFRQVPLASTGVDVRLRLVLQQAGNGAWSIILQDLAGNTVETIRPADFTSGEYWTNVVSGAGRVRISGADAPTDVQVVAYAQEVTRLQEQGTVGGVDNSLDVLLPGVPVEAKNMRSPIARLRFMTSATGLTPSCSGFLLGRDLLMTNHHCVSTEAERSSSLVEFGADSANAQITSFRAMKIEAMSRPLDYSLLRLSGNASRFGRLHVGGRATPNLDLFLLQHPDGKVKRAAFPPHCQAGMPEEVLGVSTRVDFRHTCDTQGGSSGSPVVDAATRQVVGLHHWTLLKGVPGSLNQGVHFQFIVDDLNQLLKQGRVAKAVVDEVLQPRSTP